LDAGAKTNHENSSGNRALRLASSDGHLEHVRLLLDFGADPNIADNDGWTPLMRATDNSYLKIMRVLLEGGARVSSLYKDGRTVLFNARTTVTAQLLLQHGADPRIKNKLRKTAFQYYLSSHASATRHLFENWTIPM